MADITMCGNKQCPIRKKCYRFMAKPSMWQSWSVFVYDLIKGVCPDHIPFSGGRRGR